MPRGKLTLALTIAMLTAACGGGDTDSEPTTTVAPSSTTITTAPTTTSSSTTTTTPPPTTTTAGPTTTTTTLPELTQSVVAGALTDVTAQLAAAFMNQEEAAYESLSSSIRTVLEQQAAGYAALAEQEEWQEIVWRLREEGVPSSDSVTSDEVFWFPANALFDLYELGVPGAPFVIYTGVYTVSDASSGNPNLADATVAPGTYVGFDVEGCYWERLDSAGEIIDNNFINAAPRVEVTIRASDYAFNSEDCAPLVEVTG